MDLRRSLQLPKEHGAWAMLYVSLLVGTLVAEGSRGPVLWLALAVTLLFFAREPGLIWWRDARAPSSPRDREQKERQMRRARMLAPLYLGLAALSGLPLLLQHRLWALIPMGIGALVLLGIHLDQAARREDRTIRGEILAILGLTMTAPAAHYVIERRWDATALWLWVTSALYFTSSVFYIRWRVLSAHGREPTSQRRARWHCALYHAFLIVALALFVLTSRVSLLLAIAFAPAIGRALWSVIRPARRVNLRRAGMLEIVHALLFLLFASWAFRAG